LGKGNGHGNGNESEIFKKKQEILELEGMVFNFRRERIISRRHYTLIEG
jgi:hypothetical protein